MNQFQAWMDAYSAALQGAVTHYGVVEKEDDYQRLIQFCERSAKDAADAFGKYQQEQNS